MENTNYNTMLAQVNHILSSMENDKIPIDELTEKLDEAYALIEKLKSKLFDTEIQIEQIMNSRNILINPEEDKNGSQ
ncbi:exodeoxyribonuclease VII small subunit [Silvanigrella aquatica]|uniref:Exodeoxyribonuclease VII small subunit n=1 Tax=Silvanigrella aquatica TaxID=1915309 RepID=A0A1L4D1U7_9BACT|nr:exodeoxyribonuclease VII small subunit [Silvanigrella aquatica]APJ04166.1 exodeoxyribonuclease VII small subunit [Silvanigrella aquatica]